MSDEANTQQPDSTSDAVAVDKALEFDTEMLPVENESEELFAELTQPTEEANAKVSEPILIASSSSELSTTLTQADSQETPQLESQADLTLVPVPVEGQLQPEPEPVGPTFSQEYTEPDGSVTLYQEEDFIINVPTVEGDAASVAGVVADKEPEVLPQQPIETEPMDRVPTESEPKAEEVSQEPIEDVTGDKDEVTPMETDETLIPSDVEASKDVEPIESNEADITDEPTVVQQEQEPPKAEKEAEVVGQETEDEAKVEPMSQDDDDDLTTKEQLDPKSPEQWEEKPNNEEEGDEDEDEEDEEDDEDEEDEEEAVETAPTVQPSWAKGLTQDDIDQIHKLGALSRTELITEVKNLYDQAFKLGLKEAKEMTRGKYLNIFANNIKKK